MLLDRSEVAFVARWLEAAVATTAVRGKLTTALNLRFEASKRFLPLDSFQRLSSHYRSADRLYREYWYVHAPHRGRRQRRRVVSPSTTTTGEGSGHVYRHPSRSSEPSGSRVMSRLVYEANGPVGRSAASQPGGQAGVPVS